MSEKKRILISSMYFYPENFRINEIASEWMNRGYEVSVLTGYPNYPEGKLYKGFKRSFFQTDDYQGIKVLRIPITMRGQGKFSLILNYLSFMVTGFFWALFSHQHPDKIFIFATSPIMQALPPVLFSKLRNIPCYIYVQDLWPESVESVFKIKTPLVIKPIEWFAKFIYKNCENIFVTSKGYIKAISRHEISDNKIHYWPQHAEYISESSSQPHSIENFSIIYAGNVGQAQGLDTLVHAIHLLSKEGIKENQLSIRILGDGRYKSELMSLIEKKNLKSYFHFLNRVSSSEVPQILSQYSASYLSLQDSEIFNMTIPAKLQTYLGAGVPILACANGEVPKIIDESQAGLWAPSGDAKALSVQIKNFMTLSSDERMQMGVRGSKYCKDHFEKKMLFDQMDQYLS